ncbi:MAG: hypothetical protein ACRDPM_21470 [Solirubrobacteraceae bacterium]
MFALNSHSTGLPVLDAQSDFRRARRAYVMTRLTRRLRRRGFCGCLPALPSAAALAPGPTRLEVVKLSAIVGTLDSSPHFDSGFRPASNAVRRRWERIALAHRRGEALPPVELRRQPDGYYVVDGRHRISVARAMRLCDIDAWVTGLPGHTKARGPASDSCA